MSLEQQLQDHLAFIYDSEVAGALFQKLQSRLAEFRQQHPDLASSIRPEERVSQADSILITYGDQVQEPGKPNLRSLAEFLNTHLQGIISSVHLLPFYPYSSDDGFSVIDFRAVHAPMGDWEDVAKVGRNFRLMFDAVINHVSAQSEWFQGFRRGEAQYADYFISEAPDTDLSSITRPRTSPLLTPVETASGTEYVWTTFSADQIDLNYKSPQLLLEIIEVLLFYVSHGAEFIRLDAIAYLWKEIGADSIHLPETHRVVQLFRTVLDMVAPQVMIITETNVPHQENVSYFGDGRNEAQMVYQFTLAPLILHSFRTGKAELLQNWAAGLERLPETATFFNFIASHDGIGLRPAEGILSAEEVQALADQTLAHGGQVSYRANPDGSQSAYELNITLFDMLSDPAGGESEETKIDRFMASQAIMLAMVGLPGIYIHSLVGSPNDHSGVAESGRARSINRKKWQRVELEASLANPESRAAKVFGRYGALLKARAIHPAFHPNGEQQVVSGNPALFNLLRVSPDGQERVLCIHNISDQFQRFDANELTLSLGERLRDIVLGEKMGTQDQKAGLILAPYEVRWLAR